MKHQRKLAIAGVSAAMLIGAGTGVVLNLPTGAGASSGSPTVVTDPAEDSETTATADSTDSESSETESDSGTEVKRGDVLKTSLDELVAAGTITQAQADAILAEVEANRPALGEGRGPGRGGMGHGGMGRDGMGHGMGGRGMHLEAAATALGITADELKTELEAGKTIADVATEKGVDVQTVIDAIVAEATANIVERVTDHVNGVTPEKPADTATEDSTTEDSTATTTG